MSALTFSDSRVKIAKALMVMQKNMGPVIKAATNPHFKSKYADLPAVVDAVTDALEAASLVFLQGSATQIVDGVTIVAVETTLLHESGEWVTTKLGLPVSKNDPQGVGSAITYGRRYGLQLLCGIAPEDDDGNAASRPADPPKAQLQGTPAKTIPTPQDLKLLAALKGVNLDEFITEHVRGDFPETKKLSSAELLKCEALLEKLPSEVPV